MVVRGRTEPVWRGTAGVALALLVLGTAWPGRLPGAAIAVEILLVCAGALLGQALLVDRDRPVGPSIAAGLRLQVVPLLVLVGVGIAVQRWAELRDWPAMLRDVREAAVGAANVGAMAPDSPVSSFWLVALLVQSAVVVLALRWLATRLASGIETVVLLLSVGSFVWWAIDPAGHLGARFWPVGLGVLVAFAVDRGRPVPGRLAPLAWATAVVVGLVAATVSGPVLLSVLGAVAGIVAAIAGLAPGSPVRLLGDRVATWGAALAWAGFCLAGPALRLAPEAAGRDLGLVDRAQLLLVVIGVAAVTVAAIAVVRAVVAHGVAWSALTVGALVAAVLVTVPGTERAEAIEADVAQVQRFVTADLPDCYGASEIGARAAGEPCANPNLEGTTDPAPELIGTNFEPFIGCWSQPHDDEVHVCDLGSIDDEAPRVLVVGDSHARVLFGAFRRLAQRGVLTVDATSKASCAWSTHPIKDKDAARVASCESWRENLAAWLDQHATDYDVIVTTAYSGRMVGPREERVNGLVEAWEPVAAKGVPIVALRDNPHVKSDPDQCLLATDPADWDDCATAREDVINQWDAFRPAAERVEGARFVDMWRYFCDDESCPAVIGGVGVHRDDNHVSARYAETLAPFVYREIAWTGVFRS